MEFQRIASPSLKELFVQQLERMILSGRLKVGEKLPPERQLAESMQVSRGVVNSGISELERKGFLEVHPRSGTYIADYRRKGTLDTLLSILNYNSGKLRRDEIKSILEVRIALDTLIVQLCTGRITDEEIEVLRLDVERIRTAPTMNGSIEGAFDFQKDMALFSGNMLIPLIIQSFKAPVFILWEQFCRLYGVEALYESNYGLWERISRHDEKGAIEWINTTISESISGSKQIYFD